MQTDEKKNQSLKLIYTSICNRNIIIIIVLLLIIERNAFRNLSCKNRKKNSQKKIADTTKVIFPLLVV